MIWTGKKRGLNQKTAPSHHFSPNFVSYNRNYASLEDNRSDKEYIKDLENISRQNLSDAAAEYLNITGEITIDDFYKILGRLKLTKLSFDNI